MPTQYLLGLFMLYLSLSVNSLLQSEGGPQVVTLTAVFFMLAFLAATQVKEPQPAYQKARRSECRPSPRRLTVAPPAGHSGGWLGAHHAV